MVLWRKGITEILPNTTKIPFFVYKTPISSKNILGTYIKIIIFLQITILHTIWVINNPFKYFFHVFFFQFSLFSCSGMAHYHKWQIRADCKKNRWSSRFYFSCWLNQDTMGWTSLCKSKYYFVFLKTGLLKSPQFSFQFFVCKKFRKWFYFFTCILPDYVVHEITKKNWPNCHFENRTADFLLRWQNSLR